MRTFSVADRVKRRPPLGFTPRSGRTRTWWETAWRSPMAVAWLDADVLAVRDLARLHDLTFEALDAGDVDTVAKLRSPIDRLEDRLGLTPKARKLLGWEIAHARAAAEEEESAAAPPADEVAAQREARWARIESGRE